MRRSPLANTSYISEANNYAELWKIVEKTHFYGLLAPQDSEVQNDISVALNADQLARLEWALNWGRDQIDNILREKYQVSSLTHATAPNTLKDWNARYAQWQLERRRFRQGEATSEDRKDLDEEVIQVAREQTPHSLGIPRRPSPIATAVDSKASAFDYGGQFWIPHRESDDEWPCGRNEP